MRAVYLISIIQIILWLFIFIYTYEYFTHTEVNRYRFKYWAIISILSMFQIVVIVFYDITSNNLLLLLIDYIFMSISINLTEIFIHTTKKKISRRAEIAFRIFFLTVILYYAITLNPIFLCLSLLMIATLSTIYERVYFLISFSIYAAYILISNSIGYLEPSSAAIGFVYTAHLMNGIRKMYFEEQIEEQICNE